ncbi:hypothetical protein QEN19_003955 [Hanseniaspora menglaensis]
MSYEWLNGVDSSISFGTGNNQLTNTNNSYDQLNTGSLNFSQSIPNNRPVPPPPLPNRQAYNYGNFGNAVSNDNNINTRSSLPHNSHSLPSNISSLQQNPNSNFLNQGYGGNVLSAENTNNNVFTANQANTHPITSNSFDHIYGNSFSNENLVGNNISFSSPEPTSNINNASAFQNHFLHGNQETLHQPTGASRQNVISPPHISQSFTPNYDRINYNQTVSIFGQNGVQKESPISSETQSSNNPFRQNNSPKKTPVNVAPIIKDNALKLNNNSFTVPEKFKSIVSGIPLSMAADLLSSDEIKNYRRWFQNILTKKHLNANIRLSDIFAFLQNNFAIPEHIKTVVKTVFEDIKNNIGLDNFYAILRCLVVLIKENGNLPSPNLLFQRALPLLEPKSILAINEAKEEVYEEITDEAGNAEPLDFDNFASLLMTGKTHRVKRVVKINGNKVVNKTVKFSDKLVTYEDEQTRPIEEDNMNEIATQHQEIENSPFLDFSLPMDQLLKRIEQNKIISVESQEEKEELADMQESLTHFKNLPKIDTVSLSINGSIPAGNFQHFQQQQQQNIPQPLKPTATGSANYLMNNSNFEQETKPAQMLHPTATGSANKLFSSNGFQRPEDSNQPAFLQPTATGSANHFFSRSNQNNFNDTFSNTTPNVSFGNSMGNNSSSGNPNILGDLKNIQEQIDFINQQMYGRN